MGLSRINKPEPLAKKALKALRSSILANDLTTGVVYNEKGLAADLGISRTPVREALLELSSKRLVRFLPQKGVIINTFSPKDVGDVFDVRTALEVYAIGKICGNGGPGDISGLDACLGAQKAAARQNDTAGFMDADREFHIKLMALAGNNYLMEMMHDIRDIMHLMGVRALEARERMARVIAEHEAILEAVGAGDASAASAAMADHLARSMDAVNQIEQEEEAHGKTGN
ncbi:MAG: GntR family transcriptional regulator [Desulfobacter sp.]